MERTLRFSLHARRVPHFAVGRDRRHGIDRRLRLDTGDVEPFQRPPLHAVRERVLDARLTGSVHRHANVVPHEVDLGREGGGGREQDRERAKETRPDLREEYHRTLSYVGARRQAKFGGG